MKGRFHTRLIKPFSGRGHILFPLAAWVVLGAGSLVFSGLCHAAYGVKRSIPETAEFPLAYMLVITTALLAGSAALAGARLSILRCRPRAATVLVGLACFPALVVSAGLVYALLFFRT